VALLAASATDDLDERGRRHALMLLERGDPADPLVASTRGALEHLAVAPPRPPSRAARLVDAGSARVRRLAARPRFPAAVCWIVGVWGLVSFLATLELVASLVVHRLGDDWSNLSFINWASLASSTVSGALVGLGIRELLLRHRREAAFRWFERALLVSIFVTRTFSFVESQFGAVFGVAVDVILLVCVRVLLRAEQHDAAPDPEGRTRATSGAVTA